MNIQYQQDALKVLHQAEQAMRDGERKEAYRCAAQAARLAPHLERPWLILAAVGDPSESVEFLKKALEINPQSKHARQGLQWAQKRQASLEISKPVTVNEDTARIKISREKAFESISKTSQEKNRGIYSGFLNINLLRYIGKTLISGVFTLFLLSTVVFFGIQAILPGDFASQFVLSIGSEGTQELRETLGLDMPLWQQYLTWLGHIARGDFGYTYSLQGFGAPVIEVIIEVLPATVFAYGLGTLLAFIIGNSLGKEIAFRKGRTPASIAIPLGVLLYTSFPPWLVFLMMYVIRNLIYKGYWAPTLMVRTIPVGFPSQLLMLMLTFFIITGAIFWGFAVLIQRWIKISVPGFLIFILSTTAWIGSWYLFDIHEEAWEVLQKAAMPILAFTLLSFGEILLITRTTMRETMYEDYILLAKAKGLPPRQIRDRHAARTALLPITSRMAISIPYLLSGMVMIELALGWPGIGTTIFFAVGYQNIPLLMGALIFNGIFILLICIGLDLLLTILDPRIRTRSQGTGTL